jgi:hypothetical protein
MYRKAFCLIITIACVARPPLCAAQGEYPMWTFYRDTSAARQTFAARGVSGWVKYRSSYSGYSIHPLFVYITLSSTARLLCMNYADFDFDLRPVGSSQRIANRAQVFDFGGQPLPNGGVVIVRSPCSYPPGHDAIFPFKLDELYPDLKPGTYTLKLTFSPRDKTFPPTPLTTVTFQI